MAKNLTLSILAILFAHFTLNAQLLQPCSPAVKGAASCSSACVRCPFGTIQGTTEDNTVQGALPAFCGSLSRPEWYAFVAGATSGAFLLNASACDLGFGLQMALYDDCSSAPLACVAAGGMSLTMPVSNLTLGETYFLLVDGYEGDNCTYSLQASDPALATAPALGSSPTTLTGPVITCPQSTVQYCLPLAVDNASHYTWQVPVDALINGEPGPITLPAATGTCVSVTFGQSGGQVRVTPKTSCSTGTAVSRNTLIQPLIVMQLAPMYISADDLPYDWQYGTSLITKSDTTYLLQAVLTSHNGCDSVVNQPVIVYQPNTAYGLVYWDANNNGIYDFSIDAPYPLGAVLQSAGGQFGSSGPDGKYKVTGLNDMDSIWMTPIPGLSITPSYRLFNKNQTPWAYRNFGLYPPPPNYNLDVYTAAITPVRPGFKNTIIIKSKNNGLSPANGVKMQLALPPFFNFESASVTPNITGDTLTWNVGTIAAGQQISLSIAISCDIVPIGTPFHLVATSMGVPAADDIYPGDNEFTRNGTVVGSFDPNDKQVSPAYITPDMLNSGEALEYTIRFQNTGNYPADFIRIIDTLGPGLDPGSFRFLGSSHPCTWKLSGKGVVEFFFKDINLPDSVSNEPGSHGFVSFNVRMQPTMGLGDVAENFADIYFDFNEPVRTNTASTSVAYFSPDNPPAGANMSARPNPASYVIHFAWLKPLPQAETLRLFTTNGVLVHETPVSAGSTGTDVYVFDQAPGAYVAVLDAGPQRYVKMVSVQRSAAFPVRRPGKY